MVAIKSVPVIDMLESSTFSEKIVGAFEEWGCFRIMNHGVPISLMSEMKTVIASLLDLPMEIKQRNYNSLDPPKGYTPPHHQAALFLESLSLYDMASPKAVEEFCTQLNISPHQREIICKYTTVMLELVGVIDRKLSEGLGLGGNDIISRDGICQLRMNKYSYSPESVGLTGAVMHTDASFFTILQDDENEKGLECVDLKMGELISLDPVPGTLVINVGDMGKEQGRFYNVKHRVQCYSPNKRWTIALFVLPTKDEQVEVLPGLVDEKHPCLYVPFDVDHYRRLRVSTRSPTGEALEFFRIMNKG